MEFRNFPRREFIKTSLSALALTSLSSPAAFGQTVRNRLEWNDFLNTADYASFVYAIGTMRNNTNQNDRRSWLYWINAHLNFCPHGVAYFLAWHRGYLYYFEQTLRAISGNATLMVPYWDYYSNPNIPAEFTDPASSNPLYVDRVNTNVYNALSLAPFSNQLVNFQRGTVNAFEPSVESRPHNPVHNIIGNWMADMQSPMDPIFWLHHANVDRLWSAWVATGNGRKMPASTNAYWRGRFTYATGLTLNRNRTINPASSMGYRYQNQTLPTVLPPEAQAARIIRVAMQSGQNQGAPMRPPVGRFALSKPGPAGGNRRSLGGAKEVPLDENSVSAQIPIETSDSQSLQSITGTTQTAPLGRAQPAPEKQQPPAGPYTSVQVVLDNVRLTPLGKGGGYFYHVYLNLPERGDTSSAKEKYLLGTIGPFEISGAQHHPGSSQLVFPATDLLKDLSPSQINELTVSFVRVSGRNSPKGQAIVVGEVRVEVSNAADSNSNSDDE